MGFPEGYTRAECVMDFERHQLLGGAFHVTTFAAGPVLGRPPARRRDVATEKDVGWSGWSGSPRWR